MNWTILVATTFLKDLASLPAKARQRIEEFVFVTLPAASNPMQLGKSKRLA